MPATKSGVSCLNPLFKRRSVLRQVLRFSEQLKVGKSVVLRHVELHLRFVVSPPLQRAHLELGLREDVVLVEDGVLPVPVRVKQRQDEVRVPCLVSVFQGMFDFGIVKIWLDSQRFVEGMDGEWCCRSAGTQQLPQSCQRRALRLLRPERGDELVEDAHQVVCGRGRADAEGGWPGVRPTQMAHRIGPAGVERRVDRSLGTPRAGVGAREPGRVDDQRDVRPELEDELPANPA